jgi:hypothetical protein
MALLEELADPHARLERDSFTASGQLASEADELAMVTQAWKEAEDYLGGEASYKLEWAACDLVYRSPRAYSFWEGSYILEPNLRRFDVAKWQNSITAQVMQALFAEDPPLVVVPGARMKQDSAQAWEVLLGRLMKEAGPEYGASDRMPGLRHGFKEEFNLLVEQWGLKGTGAAIYYVEEEEQCIETRKSSEIKLPAGASGQAPKARKLGPPEIKKSYQVVKRLKFEFIDLGSEDCIVWDPTAKGGDIRLAKWVIRRRLLDFYDLQKLALDKNYKIPGAKLPPPYDLMNDDQLLRDEHDEAIIIGGSLIDLFFAPAETQFNKSTPQAAQQEQALRASIHQAAPESEPQTNPLRNKLEVLEYLDQQNNHVITVLQQKRVIRSGDAEFGYLSANYWNLPNAILGIGIGQIGANNQQLAQWIVNSALKVLAINLNAPHLAPDTIGQSPRVLRIGAGKVLTVTEQAFNAGGMKLLETAKVDAAIWPVLQESTKEGETNTGADSLLVGGSTTGPRAGMGRTSGGANIMANASSTRLDGPMDHLVQQIFLPFIGAMVWFVFHHMSDQEIIDILTEEKGPAFVESLDLDNFHNEKFDYDVLLGAKLGALRNLAQSLVLMFEYGMNPQMQQFLADVHGTTIDVQTIYKLLLQTARCGTGIANEIVRPLTAAEIQRNQQAKQMAAQQGPGGKLAQIQAQGQVDSNLQEEKTFENLAGRVIDKAALLNEVAGGE